MSTPRWRDEIPNSHLFHPCLVYTSTISGNRALSDAATAISPIFFSIHVSSGRCISSLNKWTDSLAGKSCILWLAYEELSQVVGASFVSELLGDLRTLQHAVPEIAIAQKEHQQATDFWLIKKNTKKWVVIECTLNQLEHQGKRKVSPRHALLTPDLQHPLGEHAKLGQLAAAWFQPPSWQHLGRKQTEGWTQKWR